MKNYGLSCLDNSINNTFSFKILGWGKSYFDFSLWKTWKKPKFVFPQPNINIYNLLSQYYRSKIIIIKQPINDRLWPGQETR